MKEWKDKQKVIIDRMSNKFITEVKPDTPWLRSQRGDDILISRVRNQIKLYQENNLEYDTPEKWDQSFDKLNLKSKGRKSKTILRKMSWDNFLDRIKDKE